MVRKPVPSMRQNICEADKIALAIRILVRSSALRVQDGASVPVLRASRSYIIVFCFGVRSHWAEISIGWKLHRSMLVVKNLGRNLGVVSLF